MRKKLFVLILGMATIMAPISALATPYYDRASWEAAVASYLNVTSLPAGNYIHNTPLALPSGGGDKVSIDVDLTKSDSFYYTNTTAIQSGTGYTYWKANGSFYNMPNNWTFDPLYIPAFGFDMVPATLSASTSVTIALYTYEEGEILHTFIFGDSLKFFGWIGDPVNHFETYSFQGSYGIGNLVQGFGTASIPEPTTLLLLGAGLVGLVGLRRKVK